MFVFVYDSISGLRMVRPHPRHGRIAQDATPAFRHKPSIYRTILFLKIALYGCIHWATEVCLFKCEPLVVIIPRLLEDTKHSWPRVLKLPFDFSR